MGFFSFSVRLLGGSGGILWFVRKSVPPYTFVTKVLTNMTKVPKLGDQRQTGNSVVSPTGFEPVTH